MEIEKHWKEWSSICRIWEKEETFPITKAQLFDFAESYSKKQTDSFINSLDNKIYNRIRKSHGNAECRRALKEHLIKQSETCKDCKWEPIYNGWYRCDYCDDVKHKANF